MVSSQKMTLTDSDKARFCYDILSFEGIDWKAIPRLSNCILSRTVIGTKACSQSR